MSELPKQKELIKKSDWDTLIILDACRFDYFKSNYKEYVEGELKEVESAGSTTGTWITKTFRKERLMDTVYVVGNPKVKRPKGNSWVKRFTKGEVMPGDFKLKHHFKKVVDYPWKEKWNEEVRTVTSRSMAKATTVARAKYPDKRIISHFVQPHSPYVSLRKLNEKEALSTKSSTNSPGKFRKLRIALGNIAGRLLGFKWLIKIRRLFNIPTHSTSELVAQIGDKGLRDAYEKNLKLALKEMPEIREKLPGKIVITADHGELLGEDNLYGHSPYSNHPILKRVPWFEFKSC